MSDDSVQTITARFPTREAADLAIEHLTQEHGIDRSDIFVQAVGTSNTVATAPSGSDAPSGRDDDRGARTDRALKGGLEVSADVTQEQYAKALAVFDALGGRQNNKQD